MPVDVTITIDGTKQGELELELLEVVVDTNLHMPAMFSITVTDVLDESGKLEYADSDTFRVGAKVEIGVETDDKSEKALTRVQRILNKMDSKTEPIPLSIQSP